jgi:hypothetical protein
MDEPKTLIERLTDTGMTEAEIAAALTSDGVSVSQATINRIKNGVHNSTSFEIGMGLVRLAQSRNKSSKRAPALSA